MPTVPGTSTGTAQAIIGLLAQDRARTQGNREAKNAQAQLLVNGILGGVNSAVGIGELVSGIVNARDRLALDQQEADRRVMEDAWRAMQSRYDQDALERTTRIKADVDRAKIESERSRYDAEGERLRAARQQQAIQTLAESPALSEEVLARLSPERRARIIALAQAATIDPDQIGAFQNEVLQLLGDMSSAKAAGVDTLAPTKPKDITALRQAGGPDPLESEAARSRLRAQMQADDKGLIPRAEALFVGPMGDDKAIREELGIGGPTPMLQAPPGGFEINSIEDLFSKGLTGIENDIVSGGFGLPRVLYEGRQRGEAATQALRNALPRPPATSVEPQYGPGSIRNKEALQMILDRQMDPRRLLIGP